MNMQQILTTTFTPLVLHIVKKKGEIISPLTYINMTVSGTALFASILRLELT